jgi:hypothetical protein
LVERDLNNEIAQIPKAREKQEKSNENARVLRIMFAFRSNS